MSFLEYILMKESNTKKDSKGVIYDMKRNKIILLLLSFLFAERGDLISYEFIGNKLVDDIQTQLNNDFNSSL